MKVLISDDDPTMRLLMGTLLRKKLGCEVLETSDGFKAWQTLDSGTSADLCILDMRMPELSGVDLLSRLRSDPRFKRQKVILCSAETSKSAILKAAALGVSGYLLKPFATHYFLDLVRKSLECAPTQTSPPGRDALEPLESTLARLGIEKSTYLDLLGFLSKDVTAVISELRSRSAQTNQQKMETRIIGLRGTSHCLGAEALVAAIGKLENLLTTNNPACVQACIESLERENSRLIAALSQVASPDHPADSKHNAENPKPEVAANSTAAAEPAVVAG